MEEDGRLHGLLDQVGLFDEAPVGLRVGRTPVTAGSKGRRADSHVQDGPIGKLIGSSGAFGRPTDGGQGDREAHLNESGTRGGSAGRQWAHFDGHAPYLSRLTAIVAQMGEGKEVGPSKGTHRIASPIDGCRAGAGLILS